MSAIVKPTANGTEASILSNCSGLSEAEAAARLKRDGYNELTYRRRRTLGRIALEVASEPMFGLLLAAALIYLILGEAVEALILAGSAGVTIVIAVIQESRTEGVLESLRDLASPRALVIRDRRMRRIPGREVVCSDIIALIQGDRVPADARLLSANDLMVDESLLTGESVPVLKVAPAGPTARPDASGDNLAFIFSGSMIVAGHAIAEVIATGASTEIGRLGKAIATIDDEPSPLRAETQRMVRTLAALGLILSGLTILLFGLKRGSWLDAVLSGITLAMSILPEEFPLVLTIFLVMGAWRISKARVLTRRSAAIETLGAATVLCTDKTGTLTMNEMSIAELLVGGSGFVVGIDAETLPAEFCEVVEIGALASAEEPIDPMDKAFHALLRRVGKLDKLQRWSLVREYGLTPTLLAVSHVWKAPEHEGYLVAAKGAPEAIADLCGLDERAKSGMRRQIDDMARRGMRILGVAQATFKGSSLPADQTGFSFGFVGLAGLADPIRATVPEAVRNCRRAGIRVVMITGDYPATAKAIAAQAGLDYSSEAVTGDALAAMDDAALRDCVRDASVFARISPQQKLRIVNALKANGEVVAMTGDGVNDAPSLKAAHIGIAMGGRGTDTAREAASLILLDDDFGSIVAAIRLGRRIYDNLRKAMSYLLSVHVPIAGLTILPLLFDWPIVFWPVHIAFLELIIDPVSSIVFEAEKEEADVMRRSPRAPTARLFSFATVARSLIEGAWVFGICTSIFIFAIWSRISDAEVRSLTFASVVAGNLGLVLVNRSLRTSIASSVTKGNLTLWLILVTTIVLLAISIAFAPVRQLFRFGPMHTDDLTLVLVSAVATVLVLKAMRKLFPNEVVGGIEPPTPS